LKRFLPINLGGVKKSDANCLSSKSEFWNRLERALDLSKNVSEPAKKDVRLGNNPSRFVNTAFVFSVIHHVKEGSFFPDFVQKLRKPLPVDLINPEVEI
jgi:hypothetical protein